MKQANFTVTKTILNKSIQDCNAAMRDLLKESGVVDYDSMSAGDRVELKGFFSDGTETKISAYRANKRGDKRIWFSGLKNYASAGDVMALVVDNGKLVIKNITKGAIVFIFTSGILEGSSSCNIL
tara:strand:+ start:1192 stop:1566 length:375 start_codon:yes stop_codon:yes gene_type:complete